jgi:alanyl-tRNA synthetase
MTERLYYLDCSLHEFDAYVTAVVMARVGEKGPERRAAVLDRTAFYPTSGGQVHDTGWLQALPHQGAPGSAPGIRVAEVAEDAAGTIFHFLEGGGEAGLSIGTHVRGLIDMGRRRDHMQQHTGQHVLSAAFVRLFQMPTVGFHMGAESCTLDLATPSLAPEQLRDAVQLANEIIAEDRPVGIHFASRDEALARGIRKLPEDVGEGALRLIDIRDFDLTACGGTHVARTSQIGGILARGTERVRGQVRVEFVCGQRALAAAQRDFAALSATAGELSCHIWEAPQQVTKLLQQAKAAHKEAERLQAELAGHEAKHLLAQAEPLPGGARLVMRSYADRDANFLRLLARRLIAEKDVAALLGCTAPAPALLFARSEGLRADMGALLKTVAAEAGGRGGGNAQMAQGGLPRAELVATALQQAAQRLRSS